MGAILDPPTYLLTLIWDVINECSLWQCWRYAMHWFFFVYVNNFKIVDSSCTSRQTFHISLFVSLWSSNSAQGSHDNENHSMLSWFGFQMFRGYVMNWFFFVHVSNLKIVGSFCTNYFYFNIVIRYCQIFYWITPGTKHGLDITKPLGRSGK